MEKLFCALAAMISETVQAKHQINKEHVALSQHLPSFLYFFYKPTTAVYNATVFTFCPTDCGYPAGFAAVRRCLYVCVRSDRASVASAEHSTFPRPGADIWRVEFNRHNTLWRHSRRVELRHNDNRRQRVHRVRI